MIQEITGKSGAFIIDFRKISGSGWDDDFEKVINNKLSPIKISKRIIEQSWDYSEKEFDLEKDKIKFILHLNDDISPYFSLKKENITEESKQKIREWATIIAEEIGKLK